MTGQGSLLLRFRDRVRSASVAIDDARGSVSFAELGRSADAIGRSVSRRGLGGARIALLARSRADWVEGCFGALSAGATVVPLSSLYPPAELRRLVDASRVRAILATEEQLEAAAELGAPALAIEALRIDGAGAAEIPAGDGAAPALVLFTSGTTGKPKGALITHDNVLALATLLAKAWRITSRDTLLHTLPLHHLHGIGISLMTALLAGARTRMMERFDPEAVWEAMGGATVLMGVPTQHKKLFDAFDAAGPDTQRRWAEHARRLRLVTSGSAALPVGVGERWRQLTGSYPLERYGMTEAGIALGNPLVGERRPGTVGRPLEGMEVRIVGDDGREVPPGEAGEVRIAGPTVFAGYDDDEAATRDAFAGRWFRSGDTALRSADGYVTLLGRTSVDILKSGGYKLSALEIEGVLREHDALADVAVVGLPDELWGEMAVAAVVARPGLAAEVEEESIRTWARERLAPYKVPKRVVALEELPRNALGKVQKPALAAALARHLTRPGS